jgi:hypothetical protein
MQGLPGAECGGGEVRTRTGVHLHGGGDAARRGEVRVSMKGPRLLHRRGLSLGAVAVAKGSRYGGFGSDEGVLAVTTMMGSWRWQHALQSLP